MNHNSNNKNRGNRPPRLPRYNGKNIDPMGDTSRMGKFALSLFRDMSRGKFDWNKNAQTFQNKEFVMAAIIEVQERVRENETYLTALNYAYGASSDMLVTRLKDRHMRAIEGWNYILQLLHSIYISQDTSLLLGMINRLPDYRHVLNY